MWCHTSPPPLTLRSLPLLTSFQEEYCQYDTLKDRLQRLANDVSGRDSLHGASGGVMPTAPAPTDLMSGFTSQVPLPSSRPLLPIPISQPSSLAPPPRRESKPQSLRDEVDQEPPGFVPLPIPLPRPDSRPSSFDYFSDSSLTSSDPLPSLPPGSYWQHAQKQQQQHMSQKPGPYAQQQSAPQPPPALPPPQPPPQQQPQLGRHHSQGGGGGSGLHKSNKRSRSHGDQEGHRQAKQAQAPPPPQPPQAQPLATQPQQLPQRALPPPPDPQSSSHFVNMSDINPLMMQNTGASSAAAGGLGQASTLQELCTTLQ